MPVLLTSRSTAPNAAMVAGDGVAAVLGVVGVAGHGEGVLGAAQVPRPPSSSASGLRAVTHDPGALGDQPAGDAQPDPAAGAGDDRGLACQTLHPRRLLGPVRADCH